jgi:predicted Zn-dependent peptidase
MPRVLRRGCAELPDMERITEALDELYGARVEPIVRKKGELHCLGLYSDFPDDRFVPGGESVLEKTVGLLGGILLSPDVHDSLLRPDYVESEKTNLVDDIRASINDKRGYSIDRLLEEMCAGEAYGVGKLGTEDEALAITPESLTALYRSLIAGSQVEVFYCGSAETQRIEAALHAALQGLQERADAAAPKTDVVLHPAKDAPRRFTETLDVSQGKLSVGFRLGKAMVNPDYPALMVFNALYGGSITSKLFLNVRERLSLCYYASSMIDKHKGIMIVASGVDFAKFETALDEILLQLENVKNGDISDWEMTSAKRAVITAIKSTMDRPSGLEELYFDSLISSVPYDPDELCSKVEAITQGQVTQAAKDIKPDLVYFLNSLPGGHDH